MSAIWDAGCFLERTVKKNGIVFVRESVTAVTTSCGL